MYTIEELVAVAKKEFGYSNFLVHAALTQAGKKKFTLEEAHEIVDAFANKEVKG